MGLINLINNFEENEDLNVPDLTNDVHLKKIQDLANLLYNKARNPQELSELEIKLLKTKKVFSLFSHSAVKIAKSKKYLSKINKKVHLSVVFAVYKEHNRILTREEHDHGEDFLMVKINQLEQLTKDFDNVSWDMLIVDDGCPNNSGQIAQKILNEKYTGDNVEVLFLKDAIEKKLDVVKLINSTDDSRKGGSIHYGMWYAAQKKYENHIIIYTDADLSTHLGQCGLLVCDIINNNALAAIASRREPESIVVKSTVRNLRGKLFIYIWKRMLRRLNYVVDSQCGFKAFRADIVKSIILNNQEVKFAFDLELILKTDILERRSVKKIPIAWIDSDDASTTTGLQPYLTMLKSIAKLYHKYLPANAEAHKFAFFIKTLTEDQFDVLVNNVPEGIQIKSAVHYDIYDEIKVADFEEILNTNS